MAMTFPQDWPDRAPLLEAFAAALDAVDPEHAVRSALAENPLKGPVTVISIGKAAAAMARGVPGPASGIVVSDHVEAVPDGFATYLGSHPLPDDRSEAAGTAVVNALDSSDGAVLFLVSGGASALCELPAPGVSIDDLALVTDALVRSGADIGEMNVVRKHLSQLKGGRLGRRAEERAACTLVVSDVVGDRLDVIGSGPTVADPSTFQDALEVLERYQIGLPDAVATMLARGESGDLPETPKQPIAGHAASIVANGAIAAEAAKLSAVESGLASRVATTGLAGDAVTVVRHALGTADEPGMTFLAGETTVEVTGTGSGGRNQHAALAAAIELAERDDDLVFGALATDGVDGPTDGAGAVVDAGTVARGAAAGLDPREHLANHNSHPYLEASGDLLRIGPSGTNVGDLWVVWRP
ncbi:MAG: glycerate kinase type-2 family protein [Acidimicrobiia bacterium]